MVPYYRTQLMRPMVRRMRMMNDVMDEMMRNEGVHRSFRLDLEKKEDRYLVTAELPGLTKDDVQIDIEDGVLTITVKKTVQEETEEKNYLHRERRTIEAARQIEVGAVDEDKIGASLENGLLTIELPFAQEVEKKKSIAIQ